MVAKQKKLNTAAPLIISYLRFSTPEQLKGDSTRRQTDLAEKWCGEHGYKLTDRLADKGISAFRGGNVKHGALAAFLKLVEDGTVPAGSILLVEELDRISRQRPEDSLTLFLNIIRAGVTVVTLKDGCEFRRGEIDMNKLMLSVMRLCLAHEESAKKSFRLAEAWKGKRAKIGTKPLTALIPAWLKIEGDRIVEDKPKADIIRAMFDLALAGHGLTFITREANRRWPGIGRKAHFARSTVSKILHNEQAIGVFQPHKMVHTSEGKHREPVGEPIKGYYPAVVDEQTFYAVQKMMASRLVKRSGGPSGNFINLFTGIMFNAHDGSPMIVSNKGDDGRKIVSAAAVEGRKGAAPYVLFPLPSIEAAILQTVAEVESLELGDTSGDGIERELAATEGRAGVIEDKIRELKKALKQTGNVTAVIEVMAEYEAELKTLRQQADALRGDLAAAQRNSPADALAELDSMLASQATGDADIDRRVRMRNLLRQVVSRIECKVTKEGHLRRADVVVTLVDGKPLAFAVEVHVKRAGEVEIIDAAGNRSGIQVWVDGEQPATPVVSRAQIERIKALWAEGKGGGEIAKTVGVSVSTVYRHKPEGWKPRMFGRWYDRP